MLYKNYLLNMSHVTVMVTMTGFLLSKKIIGQKGFPFCKKIHTVIRTTPVLTNPAFTQCAPKLDTFHKSIKMDEGLHY